MIRIQYAMAVAILVCTSASGCGDRSAASDAAVPHAPAPIEGCATPPEDLSRGTLVVHGWPQHPPGHALGEATGVAIDAHGHLFVFHRGHREFDHPPPTGLIPEDTIVMFDADSGRELAAWGADRFSMPHGLDVDVHGQVWVTDVGLHQVLKFSHDGQLLQTFGVAGEPGNDSEHFSLPTDVVALPDGSFYVSDGYENTRIVRFSCDGEYLGAWGTPGSGPGEFNLPHGIAWDGDATLYVADRGNRRIQVGDDGTIYVVDTWGRRVQKFVFDTGR
jgi:peptidylamidoglycolate lyase